MANSTRTPGRFAALLCLLALPALLTVLFALPAAGQSGPVDARAETPHHGQFRELPVQTAPPSEDWLSANVQTNVTSSQAFEEALELLRSVIDPTVLPKAAQAQPQHAPSTPHAPHDDTLTSGSHTPATSLRPKRSRNTLADLSPYLNFLTSWGPLGTVMRLSHRVHSTLLDAFAKMTSVLPRLRLGRKPRLVSYRFGPQKSSIATGPRQWPGESPAQLWPEWEAANGRFAVHGPFLMKRTAATATESNTLGISHLVTRLLSRTSVGKRRSSAAQRGQSEAAASLARALSLLEYAADPPQQHRPSADALWVLAQHHVLGTHGAAPQPWKAAPYLTRLVESIHPGNSSARSLLGWIEGSRELWNAWGAGLPQETFAGQSQSMSLLHHTFAAWSGSFDSMMALAYRHHAGIGTPVDCDEALKWYNRAATNAWARYKDGPVGGLTVPYTHLRLSDLAGGAYGPGASAASTGWEAYRPAVQASLHSLTGSGQQSTARTGEPSQLNDLLEYYSYHAQGGSDANAIRLARIYYSGSIYGTSESAGRVERDFAKVKELSLKVARKLWPTDVAKLRMIHGDRISRTTSERGVNGGLDTTYLIDPTHHQAEPSTKLFAGSAAALLGRMYLRGEGVPISNHRAWMWFWRGTEVGDRDCLYGYGLMRSLGLAPDQLLAAKGRGSPEAKKGSPDWKGAIEAWEKAIRAGGPSGHAEASAALGKVHFDMGDIVSAARHFAHAVTWGSPFEGHFLLAMVNANIYKKSLASVAAGESGGDTRCRATTVHFKQAAERGDWESPLFHRGMRAWELGDKRRALVYWSMAAERGDEAAENNIAWALDRDKRKWKVPRLDGAESNATDRVGLVYWTRSAAQGNVDAMVKMGDYYYHGIGLSGSTATAAADDWVANVTGSSNISTSQPSTAPGPSFEKAMACYTAAADRQVSALAWWNMGFLYEEGLGVPRRDFHLAKRYYDMALATNREAYLPVMLSLIRLHLKALWATVWQGEESAVALFSSYALRAGTLGGYTEAEEEILRSGRQGGQGDDGAAERHAEDIEFGGEANLPESYDLRRHARLQHQQHQQDDGHRQGQGGAGAQQGNGNNNGIGLMSVDDDGADAMIEGAMIVIGLSALAMLVYARQAAQARAEQERREEEQRRLLEVARDPARAQQIREQDAQPGGPRYAGGLPWPPDAAGPQMGL